MVCWAVDSFANDDAADWLTELEGQSGLSLVERTLDEVLDASNAWLDAQQAARALVAAEVIASARGQAGLNASAEPHLARWIAVVRPDPDAGLVARALLVIDRVLAEGSELRTLWQESGEFDAWRRDVLCLRARLMV